MAADLLSQAEHDKLASPVLVTDSPERAKAVQAELEVQIPQLPLSLIHIFDPHAEGGTGLADVGSAGSGRYVVEARCGQHLGQRCV